MFVVVSAVGNVIGLIAGLFCSISSRGIILFHEWRIMKSVFLFLLILFSFSACKIVRQLLNLMFILNIWQQSIKEIENSKKRLLLMGKDRKSKSRVAMKFRFSNDMALVRFLNVF